MANPPVTHQYDARVLWLKAALLAVWAGVSFVFFFFARDLQFVIGGWPFAYWMGAQGAILVFIAIVVVYAVVMQRLAPQDSEPDQADAPYG